MDLHLITHPESADEVRRVAGARTRIVCVRGLTAPEFLVPRDRGEARRDLGLPAEGGVVLVSGGGWGVGDVAGAVDVALTVPGVATAVALCGRNDDAAGPHPHALAGRPAGAAQRDSPTAWATGWPPRTRSCTPPEG